MDFGLIKTTASSFTSFVTMAIILGASIAIRRYFEGRKVVSRKPIVHKDVHTRKEADAYVSKLKELGYFKYVASDKLEFVCERVASNYQTYGTYVSEIYDKNFSDQLDFRCYDCDGENLYEEGGFTATLETLKPFFDKIRLDIIVTDHYEECDDNNRLNHIITINGTKHVIFEDFEGFGWGIAAEKLAEILNYELEKQGKEDRVYLINGGNDGSIVFLSDAQFAYIGSISGNQEWKPMKLDEWRKIYQIE